MFVKKLLRYDDTKYLKTNVTIRVANVSFPSTRGPHKENHEGRNQQRYHDVMQFYVSVYFTVAPKGSTLRNLTKDLHLNNMIYNSLFFSAERSGTFTTHKLRHRF